MPNKPKFQGTLAQIYKTTYDLLFHAQTQEMKDRILACKGDNSINDPDVTEFIRNVCVAAEKVTDDNPPVPVADNK